LHAVGLDAWLGLWLQVDFCLVGLWLYGSKRRFFAVEVEPYTTLRCQLSLSVSLRRTDRRVSKRRVRNATVTQAAGSTNNCHSSSCVAVGPTREAALVRVCLQGAREAKRGVIGSPLRPLRPPSARPSLAYIIIAAGVPQL